MAGQKEAAKEKNFSQHVIEYYLNHYLWKLIF